MKIVDYSLNTPFIVISSSDKNRNIDTYPKGDRTGFVKDLDDKTPAVPDRLGNKTADTFMNVLQIPRVKESLPISGAAQIVQHIKVLELLSHKGRLPNLVMILHVEKAFLYCPNL